MGEGHQSLASEGDEPTTAVATEARIQEDGAAEQRDLELIAKAAGWTFDDAVRHRQTADAIERVAREIEARSPETFVGSELSREPDGPATLYLKGEADPFVRSLIAAESSNIRIEDNQPFSQEELDARTDRLAKALGKLGYKDYYVASPLNGKGKTEAIVTTRPALAAEADQILGLLPQDLRTSSTLEITDVPVGVDFAGGQQMRLCGTSCSPLEWTCTSGFVVTDVLGSSGITSAK